jgi:hypothetical protein
MADEVAPSGLTLAGLAARLRVRQPSCTSMSPASTSSSTASRRAPRANWPTCSVVPPCQCRRAAARQRALRAPGAGAAPVLGRVDEGGGRRRIGRVADQDELREIHCNTLPHRHPHLCPRHLDDPIVGGPSIRCWPLFVGNRRSCSRSLLRSMLADERARRYQTWRPGLPRRLRTETRPTRSVRSPSAQRSHRVVPDNTVHQVLREEWWGVKSVLELSTYPHVCLIRLAA